MSGVSEEFADPRLVALHDSWDPVRADIPFLVDLAAQLPARSIVDLGCGTGRLAVELALRGHQVTAVDPSPAMLEHARHRPGASLVRWTEGDASCLGVAEYDLAVLAGQVVEVITDDRDLLATFTALRRALRPGGTLSFDSRNPITRCWLAWTPRTTRRLLADGVEAWFQDVHAEGDRVRYQTHYRFPDGTERVSHNERRFRSYAWLVHALADVGFAVDPMDYDDPNLVFLASATPPRPAVALRFEGTPPADWRAVIRYDPNDSVTVALADLDTVEVLARLRRLRVPAEMVYREARRLGLDWDPEREVHRRSEADMSAWRQRDREHRERLKHDFLRRRSED
ncbi:class I SAM-dependent methyltransferase [Plantactinospora sonchi]|uniref:Class I SAM-dependent methyltransferase n=1 Tax=Plantactinospora sonchi TaxID=1544735 RepID=A0ABU7RS68_9ACTN